MIRVVRGMFCFVFCFFRERFAPLLQWIALKLRLFPLYLQITSRLRHIRTLSLFRLLEGGNATEENDANQSAAGSAQDVERLVVEGQDKPRWKDFRNIPTDAEYEEDVDEFYCDYDSTWETEESQYIQTSRRVSHLSGRNAYMFRRFENAARDMQNFRHGYPNLSRIEREPDDMPNLRFYLEEIPSLPDGIFISEFHKTWFRDYSRLEYVHTFIQWLFPLEEPGMNSHARTLTKQEIKRFCENDQAKKNLLESYKLMLDFYGIELVDAKKGKVTRATNWRERFNNLNSHTHNNLRITRILKCLGTLGYRHYQAPLVHFFLEQTLIEEELPNVKESLLNYFVFAVLEKKERRKLLKFAYRNYNSKQEFVWCPREIQRVWCAANVETCDDDDEDDE